MVAFVNQISKKLSKSQIRKGFTGVSSPAEAGSATLA